MCKCTIQMHVQMQADSLVQTRTNLLISWLRPMATRRERHNSYNADHTTWPHKHAADPVMFKISVGRDPKNPTTSSTLNCMAGTPLSACIAENSFLCRHGPMSPPNYCAFKILKFSAHLFWAWRHAHSSPITSLGVYYDNGDCHILCVRA